jgi:hypothetical protein
LSVNRDYSLFRSTTIYKSKTGVGVFLRGPRGTNATEVQARLAPHAKQFEQLVGTCRDIGDNSNHPGDDLKIDTEDQANWDTAVDWLHDRAHAFLSAVNKIFSDLEG